MKKIVFLAVMVMLVTALPLMGVLNPNVKESQGLRASGTSVQLKAKAVATVTADAAALTATTSSWTHAKALCVPVPVEWGNISLSFYGYGDGDGTGSPNNATFSFDVFLVDLFGGIETVSLGNTGTIGAQQLSCDPTEGTELNNTAVSANYCWADTIEMGAPKTTSTIARSDYQGGDGLAKVKFDRHSAYGIYVRIYNMTDQSVTSITCVMNGFNQ